MSTTLFDTIRSIVQQEIKQLRLGDLAVVQELHSHSSESDKDNYSCTVVLRDSSVVLKKVPVATSRTGLVATPDVGDLVLVQFLHGDINAPIIVASLYNDEDRPPVNSEGQVVLNLPKGASKGEGIYLKASSLDKSSLIIDIGGTVKVNLQDDDPAVEISIADGRALIKIDKDGSIKIESQNKIAMKSDSDFNIEAAGQLNLKGSIVNIN